MKRALLTLLLAFIVVSAPWRLMALSTQLFVVHPGLVRVATTDVHYWDALALEARLEGMGWSVTYAPSLVFNGTPAYGLTNPMLHAITVDSALHWDARYAVLAHEAGHTLEPTWVSRTEGDCFAEGVAALVVGDPLREHARYMSPTPWQCSMFFVVEWPRVYRAAAVFVD